MIALGCILMLVGIIIIVLAVEILYQLHEDDEDTE